MERSPWGLAAPGTTGASPRLLPVLAALLLALVLAGWSANPVQAQDYSLRTTELAIEGMT